MKDEMKTNNVMMPVYFSVMHQLVIMTCYVPVKRMSSIEFVTLPEPSHMCGMGTLTLH